VLDHGVTHLFASMKSFHFSVDDVLPSLIEVTDKKLALREHAFFADLWRLYKEFNVKTGLHVFSSTVINGQVRSLSEVRNLQPELSEGWLFFGPHALNDQSPPYAQTLEEQVTTFDAIFAELDRIAGAFLSQSIRLHHYSECYELAEYFLARGVKELFLTDKPAATHRLDSEHRNRLIQSGKTMVDGLTLSSTHYRVEDLANQATSRLEFLESAGQVMNRHGRLVIYSHEYEHLRPEVVEVLYKTMHWLAVDLGLTSEQP
jgi:hypothetical protein